MTQRHQQTALARAREWVASPSGRAGIGAGLGGLVLGVVIGLCAGGGDADPAAPIAGSTVATLAPILPDAADTAAPASQPQGTDSSPGTAAPASGTVNPLTGERTNSGPRRVIAVKVDNVPAAQPQIGLGDAEMIIEVPVEGGLTRFTGLFHDAASSIVGPVRSIRPVDADLLAPFQPLLVTTGGRDFVEQLFDAARIPLIGLDSDGAFIGLDRQPPHHLGADLAFIDTSGGDTRLDAAPFPFGGELESEDAAETVTIPFSAVMSVEWRFDEGRWVRRQNGSLFEVVPTEFGTPEPLTVDTIVILSVAERPAGYVDSVGASVPTFDVIGFGDAIIVNDGKVLKGRWLRGAQEDPWVLVDEGGRPVSLPPGRVFVEIVPRAVDVTIG